MNRRNFLKIGAVIPFIPMLELEDDFRWGLETPPWEDKKVLDLSAEALIAMRDCAKEKGSRLTWDINHPWLKLEEQRLNELCAKTVVLSNRIHRMNLERGGNFIIASPMSTLWYTICRDYFKERTLPHGCLNSPGNKNTNYIRYLGDLCSRWRLYTTGLYAKSHDIVIGCTADDGKIKRGARCLGYMNIFGQT